MIGGKVEEMTMNKEDLSLKIELIRKEMIKCGMKEGISAEKTIKISQQLDELLNCYDNVINGSD